MSAVSITRVGSLFAAVPVSLPEELIEVLAEADGVRIERIVSRGHVTPADSWYDQSEHEFVLVVAGAARLEVAERGELALGPGDYADIPAHVRHRVSWTAPDLDTVWLAVFYRASPMGPAHAS